MFPVGSYDRILADLHMREYHGNLPSDLAVGILVADCRRQYCQENIINHLRRFDKKSGKLIDFFLPGYCHARDLANESVNYTLRSEDYAFSPDLFDDFLDQMSTNRLEPTGHVELILASYHDTRLDLFNAIRFDIEKEEREGIILSPMHFFQQIFDIAKKTTEFEAFKGNIRDDRRRDAIIAFVKEKLPDQLLGLLINQ